MRQLENMAIIHEKYNGKIRIKDYSQRATQFSKSKVPLESLGLQDYDSENLPPYRQITSPGSCDYLYYLRFWRPGNGLAYLHYF